MRISQVWDLNRGLGSLDTSPKNGKKNKGIARQYKATLRAEAEERNANTKPERTRQFRRNEALDKDFRDTGHHLNYVRPVTTKQAYTEIHRRAVSHEDIVEANTSLRDRKVDER